MIFAGVLAGGVGSRMENAVMPKQFLSVCGVPIFARTIRTFLSVEKVDKIVVSVNVDWEWKYREIIENFDLDADRIVLTPGGDSRFTSMMNVVKTAKEIAGEEDAIIVTHDCARLFVSREIIENNISAMRQYDIVTTSLPVIDTVLSSDDGKSITSVPVRSKLWNDQGPQTFHINEFLAYADQIPAEKIAEYIEAVKLYLEHNKVIGIIPGDRYNFKVTNDFDLKYSEFLLKEGYVK